MLAFGYDRQHRREGPCLGKWGEKDEWKRKVEDGVRDVTFRTHTQINALNNIHKRFILLVLYIRPSPTRNTRCLTCDFWWFFLFRWCDEATSRYGREGRTYNSDVCGDYTLCRYICFQCVDFTVLWVSEIVYFYGMIEYFREERNRVYRYWPSMSSYITTKLFFTDSSSILPKYALQILIKR